MGLKSNVKCLNRRQKRRQTRRKSHVNSRLIRVIQPQAKGSLEPLEAGRGKTEVSYASRGSMALLINTLVLDFWPLKV